MTISSGGDALCIEVVLDRLVVETEGFSERFINRLEDVSRDLTAKSRNGALLLLTLKVHRNSFSLVL